jgi:hypothetical protein
VKPISPYPSENRHNKDTGASGPLRAKKKRRHTQLDPAAQEAFGRFYAAYPRHVARAAAEKAWLKINPDVELSAVIISSAERYAEETRDTELGYIAYPASWLKGRRWEDEPNGNRNGRPNASRPE